MEYILSGKISLDDYIQFNRAHGNHGAIKVFRLIFYPIIVIIFISMFIYDFQSFIYLLKEAPLEFIKIWYPLIILIIFLILLNKIIMPLIYKRNYNKNKLLQMHQKITINETNIITETDASNSTLTKEHINKIIYDKDSVYIYLALNAAIIIKKRFLENENDFDEFVEFIKDNYENKPKESLWKSQKK
ncbi:MAG: YcxB family protein [Treponema sp.]|jgi:hypothetical protein|nr:YcxB family protein [Treponema sp.]